MSIKVRAVSRGIYKDRPYNPGEVFEVEDAFFADVTQGRFGWMEKVEDPAPTPAPKPAPAAPFVTPEIHHGNKPEDRRDEPRDPGEHDQHLAEKKGLI